MYYISECFVAPQGEGVNAGKLMIFLRMAGCSVGKRFPKERYEIPDIHKPSAMAGLLPIYTNECKTWDGRAFECDTDYRPKIQTDLDGVIELLRKTHPTCSWVCLTGGEPLMHAQGTEKKNFEFWKLIRELRKYYKLQIETSGTINLATSIHFDYRSLRDYVSHLAIAPKFGFLPAYTEYAHEYKILVDDEFEFAALPNVILEESHKITLMPINFENSLNKDNMQKCLDIQLAHPEVRIGTQLHKLWGTR